MGPPSGLIARAAVLHSSTRMCTHFQAGLSALLSAPPSSKSRHSAIHPPIQLCELPGLSASRQQRRVGSFKARCWRRPAQGHTKEANGKCMQDSGNSVSELAEGNWSNCLIVVEGLSDRSAVLQAVSAQVNLPDAVVSSVLEEQPLQALCTAQCSMHVSLCNIMLAYCGLLADILPALAGTVSRHMCRPGMISTNTCLTGVCPPWSYPG